MYTALRKTKCDRSVTDVCNVAHTHTQIHGVIIQHVVENEVTGEIVNFLCHEVNNCSLLGTVLFVVRVFIIIEAYNSNNCHTFCFGMLKLELLLKFR